MAKNPSAADTGTDTAVKERIKVKNPKMYRVILLNDDFTTMEFVVRVLESLFFKQPVEAVQIMLQVHKCGRGVAGVFSKQIAEAKIEQVHSLALQEGFPLRCDMEEA